MHVIQVVGGAGAVEVPLVTGEFHSLVVLGGVGGFLAVGEIGVAGLFETLVAGDQTGGAEVVEVVVALFVGGHRGEELAVSTDVVLLPGPAFAVVDGIAPLADDLALEVSQRPGFDPAFGPIDFDEALARGGVEVALGDLGGVKDLERVEGVPGIALGDAALGLLFQVAGRVVGGAGGRKAVGPGELQLSCLDLRKRRNKEVETCTEYVNIIQESYPFEPVINTSP